MLSALTSHPYSIELGSPQAWDRDQPAVWALPASVSAGFPSPADDHRGHRIDVFAQLVKHPQATYTMRVRGDLDARRRHQRRGCHPGRPRRPTAQWPGGGGRHRRRVHVQAIVDAQRPPELKAANPTYPDIVPGESQQVEVWGVVIAAVKQFSL